MKIKSPCVVTLTWHMQDSMQQDIGKKEDSTEYFYGGNDLLPKVEEALLDHQKGDQLSLYLEPEHAFGEYDSALVFFEESHIFPLNTEPGMQFEGLPEGAKNSSAADVIFNVTEVYDNYVVVDGNHPLAGISLRVHLEVVDVREATEEEIQSQSASENILTILSPLPAAKQIH
ncbi:MAG: FKBP-type peptidyl-prolyl cis-trans isomerase [Saezia sp.]